MDQVITIGRVNITQVIMTAIAVVGLLSVFFAVVRQAIWKAWSDWKINQLEANNLILRKQQELQNQLENINASQIDLQHCVHAIPGHPENPSNNSGLSGGNLNALPSD